MLLQEVPCYLRTVTASFYNRTTSEQLAEGMEGQRRQPNQRDCLGSKIFPTESSTHREGSVVESVILIAFEEVSVAIGVLQSSVDVVGDSFPVGDGFRISRLDWRSLEWVESPELTSLVEVNLSVSTPNHRSVDVVRHACEAFIDLLRVISIKCSSVVSPVLRSLEEVSLAVLIGESCVDVVGKSRPAV